MNTKTNFTCETFKEEDGKKVKNWILQYSKSQVVCVVRHVCKKMLLLLLIRFSDLTKILEKKVSLHHDVDVEV